MKILNYRLQDTTWKVIKHTTYTGEPNLCSVIGCLTDYKADFNYFSLEAKMLKYTYKDDGNERQGTQYFINEEQVGKATFHKYLVDSVPASVETISTNP